MDRCNPATSRCCFKIVVQRKHKGRVEVAEFHNRPEHEASEIQQSYAPGSHAFRKEGWKITEVSPTRCSRSWRDDLGRPGRRRRKR